MDVRNPSPQAVLAATMSLTAAQIRALDTVPVQLVAAPGAGKIIAPLFVAMAYHFGTVAFSPSNNDPLVRYAGDTTPIFGGAAFQGVVTAANSTFIVSPVSFSLLVNVSPGDDNKALQILALQTFNAGPIVTATRGAAGLGYAPGDTGTINDGSDDATYVIDTVGALGVVLTFHVTGAGTDYTIENGVATAAGGAQPGVGAGFTVNITAVTTGDGTLKVTTFYSIVVV